MPLLLILTYEYVLKDWDFYKKEKVDGISGVQWEVCIHSQHEFWLSAF